MKNSQIKAVPVNLLVNQKKCLVVGASKAAYHKIKALQTNGAELTVIALESSEAVGKLLSKTTFLQRKFSAEDITDDIFLVIAATDNFQLNSEIGAICKRKKILFSRADSDWTSGDFFRPASFNENMFTVSVSTGGESCRKSRLMKEMLKNETALSSEFDCFLATIPKPAPADDLKRELSTVRGVTDVHSYYTAKNAVLTAIVMKNENVAATLTKLIKFCSSEAELYFGEDAFFNPVIKNIEIPKNRCLSQEWIAARHSGDVLTYNKFIGKIK